ncbi:MAG: hypothetical protein Q7K26_06335 [bacterium]|nr:hypothetical protein [bacterium]
MITFEEIIKKHPRCFTKQSIRNQELYGSCIPTGWGNLLDELCSKIEVALAETDAKFSVTQIKEKFGRLRFGATRLPIIEDLINDAIRRSAFTCTACGSRGSPAQIGGYLSPLCPHHFSEGVRNKLLDLIEDAAIEVEIYNSAGIYVAHLFVLDDREKYEMYISDLDLRLLAEMLSAISIKMDHVKFPASDEDNDLIELTAEEKSIFESALSK